MSRLSSASQSARTFEAVVLALAAAICLVLTALIWRSVSAVQQMWPLPALYFIEVVLLTLVGGIAFVWGGERAKHITWIAAGMLAAFCVLGAWSVGFAYLPVLGLLLLACLSHDFRQRTDIAARWTAFAIAAALQATIMLTVIRLV